MQYIISYIENNRGRELFWDGERFQDWSESAKLYVSFDAAKRALDNIPAEYARDDLQIYGQVNE